MTGGLNQINKVPQVVHDQAEGRKIRLTDESGRYAEKYLEKFYQILKPHLKGLQDRNQRSFREVKSDLQVLFEHDPMKELILKHRIKDVISLTHHMALRGLFLVDYDKFPSYQEAAEEAFRLIPNPLLWLNDVASDSATEPSDGDSTMVTQESAGPLGTADNVEALLSLTAATQQDHHIGFTLLQTKNAKNALEELPSPQPWEILRLPNMDEIEINTSWNIIPSARRMRFLPAPEPLAILDDKETSDTQEIEHISIPSSDEHASIPSQSTEPNVNDLQHLELGHNEASEASEAERIRPYSSSDQIPVLDRPTELRFSGLRLLRHNNLAMPDQVLEEDEIPNFAALSKPDITNVNRFGRPSRIVRVTGIKKGIDEEQILEEFVNFSPVNLRFQATEEGMTGMADFRFNDIEAASKALIAKHGASFAGRALRCYFVKETMRDKRHHARTIIPKLSANGRSKDLLSSPGNTLDELPSPCPTPGTAEAISETPTDVKDGTMLEAPTQVVTDESFESRDNEPEDEQSQDHPSTLATSQSLETDNDMASAEPLALYGSKTTSRPDQVHPEISQYALLAVPGTRAFYLPYAAQHKIICSLQASLEEVCFAYMKRKIPKVLRETQKQWAIDSPHALELNSYIYMIRKKQLGLEATGLGNSRSMHDLYESMIALRHHAVHRTRVNIQALRQWTSDASIFAATLGDSTAAAKYAPLDEYLEVQYRRIEADRREAEDRLLATVKDLAKKRAELDRVEREAMRRFEEEHKQSSERVLVDLDRVIDASDPLDHGLKVSFQETSPTEPSSDILEETVLSEPVLSILEQTSSMKPVSGNSEATSSTMPSSSVLQESSLTESASNNLGETSSTDPISGVFGRLKLWYGA
jgi:hypothetical protein